MGSVNMPREIGSAPRMGAPDISELILDKFYRTLKERLKNDVLIISAGTSALVAAWKLAERGYKVTVLEEAGYLGGSLWVGESFVSHTIVTSPAERILEELGVEYEEVSAGVYWVNGPLLAAKLITRALEAGAWFLNFASVDDVLIERGRVAGLLVRWSPVQGPVGMRAKVVIDASGRDAVALRRLVERGLVDVRAFRRPGIELRGETGELIVENTMEVYPGLIVSGITVAEMLGIAEIGPGVGPLLLSGEKAAMEASRLVEAERESL